MLIAIAAFSMTCLVENLEFDRFGRGSA